MIEGFITIIVGVLEIIKGTAIDTMIGVLVIVLGTISMVVGTYLSVIKGNDDEGGLQ